MSVKLTIATRRSALALWQAEHVKALLERATPGLEIELLRIVTEGDRIQDRALSEVGGKGLFIKELELAMADGRAHLAVHSMKDVPWNLPPGFCIAAVLPRADARDAFVSQRYPSLNDLPHGARVGTSSQRRQTLLRALRPDLTLLMLRGNVDTRLAKLDSGDYDAIVLAAAGLTRLGLRERITEYLDPAVFVPAVGQGAIGIECREEPGLVARLAALDDATTARCLAAERAFAAALGASCTSPIAAHATEAGAELTLAGVIGEAAGGHSVRGTVTGPVNDAAALGHRLATDLLARGGRALMQNTAAPH